MGGRQWAGPVQGHNAPDRSGAAQAGGQGKVQGGGRKLHWRGILKIIRKIKDRISMTKSIVMDMIVFLLVLNLLVVMVMLIIPVHKI